MLLGGGYFIGKVVPDFRLVSGFFIRFGRKDGDERELIWLFKDS